MKVLPVDEVDAGNMADSIMKAIRLAGSEWAAVLPAEEEAEPMTYQTLLEKAVNAGSESLVILHEEKPTIRETLFRAGQAENDPVQSSAIENAFD